MPIYMDRHDVPDVVSAEDIAHLHLEDLKVQDHFGCRGLTYWFDDKRKTAFCLIEAPNPEALQKMHRHAHGEVPNSIIEVESSIVESFLGRIADPLKAQNTELNIINDPAFRVLMVISFNWLAPPAIKESIESDPAFGKFKENIRQALANHAGTVARQSAENLLVSFVSVSKAVRAAETIQQQYHQFGGEKLIAGWKLKIALNAGIPVTDKNSIFEDTIRLAERMSEAIEAEIIVSAEVKELYQSENENKFIRAKNLFTVSTEDEQFLTQLMNYTDSIWTDVNFKIIDFEKPLGFSKSQLYRKMVSLTGKSPNTFIKDYRLKEALKLFREKTRNISEIAFESGFSSPSYFTKCFQKQYGYPPSEFLAG